MKNKAMAHRFLAAVLIAAIALLLMVSLILEINRRQDDAAGIKECQASIEAYIRTRQLSLGAVSQDINCPTKYTTIESNDREKIKQEVANRMADCWRLWKRGDYGLSDQNLHTMFCHVCEVITFENKGIQIPAQEMASFCRENKLGGERFVDYLSPVFFPLDSSLSDEDWSGFACSEVNTAKRYAIIYAEYYDLREEYTFAELGRRVLYMISKAVPSWEYKYQGESIRVSFRVNYDDPNLLSHCHMTIAGQ